MTRNGIQSAVARAFTSVALVASLAGIAGCQTVQTTEGGTVGVDRKQHFLVSSEQINESAAQAYQQVLKDAQSKGQLNRDQAQLQRVRAIAQRLIPATGAFRPDAPGWKWEVNVISSDEVNAWCMPGGKIAVYTGLIKELNITDDELAAVMGHEIAHALREHGREQASQQMAQQLGVQIGAALLGVGSLGQQLTQVVLDTTFNLPHSRTDETEADRIGVELAARAGYDPRAAVALWQKMEKVSGGSRPPQWLSTHPDPANRIKDVQEYSQRVLPLYQQAQQAKR
jgi:predicted Zn-dependent protease